MKTKILSLLLCVGLVVACNNTQKGAGIGAGGGALLGAVIGHFAGNAAIGAAVGGAVGLRRLLSRFRTLRFRPFRTLMAWRLLR